MATPEDAIPLAIHPVGTGFTAVSGFKATIPGYNLTDRAIRCSPTTKAMCLDVRNSRKYQALDESALLHTLKSIASFP